VADQAPVASGHFPAGTQVAGYRLAEHIGWGGMAVVYRAYDFRLDRWVALKILAPEIARDASFRQRFISESRAAAAVDHPHIIPVFEAGEASGVLFIAMRYVGGGDVGTLVRRCGPLGAARAVGIIGQVASALDAAHAAGLVHRDVKPANMLLGAASADSAGPDHVYLTDFGLSRQALSTAGPTLAGQFVGTLDYMAPEQLKHRPVDGRADLYALACTAYEMLAGEPPFRRTEDLGLMWAQLAEPPPPLTSLRPDLPSAIDQVLTRGMAKSPADRYHSCPDFAAAMAHACGLEWSVTGRLLAGQQAAATRLAAPVAPDRPAVTRARAAGRAAAPGQIAGPAETPARARRPASALLPAGVARMPGGGAPATVDVGLAGLRLAERGPGGHGPGGHGPGGRGPGGRGPGGEPDRRATHAPRGRSPVAAAALLVVILAIAGGAFLTLRGGGASHSGNAAHARASAAARPGSAPGTRIASGPSQAGDLTTPASPPRSADQARPAGPAATVKAYVAAINRHDYRRAWHLGGRNSSPTYAAFARGFGTTAKDTLIILSVSGNVVTARLVAVQADGSIKTYQGTYAVDDGMITKSNVVRIG
jgi:hypothetical protein